MPTLAELEAIVPDRLVFLRSYDGHTAWVSPLALAKAGITRATADPPGGAILRDAQGNATGILKESAVRLVSQLVPSPAPFERYRALRKGLELAASYGLTSIFRSSFDEEDLKIIEQVLSERGLKVRFYASVPLVKDPSPETLGRYDELRTKHVGPLLRFGAVKGFVDGVVESETAAMFAPYPGGGTGLLRWTQEDLDRTVALYDKAGYQVFLHAIGDRAIAMALSAYEYAAKTNDTRDRRHPIEPAEGPRPAAPPPAQAHGRIPPTPALYAHPTPHHL